MTDAKQPSIVVDVWTVADGDQQEFIDTIVALFERMRAFDGFIAGELLQGANTTHFVSFARMRSAQDRDRVVEDRDIRMALRNLGGIARPHLNYYSVLRSFHPAEPPS